MTKALEKIRTPVRMVVACGRHKVDVLKKAAEKNWFNVLVTDADTAAHVMESQKTTNVILNNI